MSAIFFHYQSLIKGLQSRLARPRFKTVVSAAVLILLAADFILHYGIYRIHSSTVDFPSFYYGAKAAFQIDKSPYSPPVWKVMQKSYTDARLFPYLYPPPSLLFFYPFSLLDFQSATLAMLILNNLLVLAFLYLFLFKVMELQLSSYLVPILAAYLYWFFPLVSTIKTGQINLVILVSICLTWLAMKRRLGPLWVALPLALGILLKLYPVVFIPLLLFRREYKALIALALILLIVSLASTWALPPGIWRDWYEHVAANGYSTMVNGMAVGSGGNQSINGLLTRLFFGGPHRVEALLPAPPLVTRLVPYLASGLVLLVSLAVTYLSTQRSSDDSLDLQFSLWLLVLFLIAPISWDHLLVLVVPCLYIAARRMVLRREIPQAVLLAAVAVLLAWEYPYNDPAFTQGLATLLNSAKFFAVAAVWVYYAVWNLRLWQHRPGDLAPPTAWDK